MAVTLTCVAGNITFYHQTSSEADYDYLIFYIDGNAQWGWSGETAWALKTYPVTTGSHTFTWTYIKDFSDVYPVGSDTAWLDDITFPLGSDITAPTVTAKTPTSGSTITSDSVDIDVSFSKLVNGVDASDMVLSGAAAAASNPAN